METQSVNIAVFYWSGNNLDEPVSFLAKIMGIGAHQTRKGMAVHAVIAGIILFVIHIVQTTADPTSFTAKAIQPYSNFFTYYVIASLIVMSTIFLQRPYITPEVNHAKCPICKIQMTTTRLYCENCKKSFG